MTAHTVTHAELRAGDLVTGYTADGRTFTLPQPREIAADRRRAEDGAVEMARPGPNPHGVEWWLYPDQADAWTVERPDVEPEPAAPAAPIAAGTLRAQLQAETGATLAASERMAEARGAVWVDPAHPRRRDALAALAYIAQARPENLAAQPAAFAVVGDAVVMVWGSYTRAGLVVETSRGRVRVEYATPTGARYWQAGRIGRTFRPWVSRDVAWLIPPASPWAQSLRRRLAGPQD